MKVGLISYHSFLQPGGVKRHILGLHEEFKKRGIKSKIIAPRRSGSENYGKDVILLGTSFPFKISGSQSDLCVNFNQLAIKKILDKEKFDVLHFHNCGFPSTLQILTHSGALNVLTFHANIEESRFLKQFPIFRFLLEKIARWKADGIIGVASFNLKPFRKYRGPKAIIPNGIDLNEFNPRIPKIKKFSGSKVNILFVGRIEERKGLIYLLRAYKVLSKKFSGLRLIIVGEGKLKEKCQKWARQNKLPEVYFEGEKTGKELPYYYATADIFVSPAVFGESFGIVLLEAMASGVPVVAFANKGYREFLKDKKGGFLVKPRDYKSLAEKIEILIKNDGLRKKMGEWGQKEAQDYSWPKIAGRVLDFYQLCLKEKKKRPRKGLRIDRLVEKLYNNISGKLKKQLFDIFQKGEG